MIHFSIELTYFQVYLILANLFSFFLFTYDKYIALNNNDYIKRVSENKLLLVSFMGGSIGSLIAMLLFRHKVKKAVFVIKYAVIILLQVVLLIYCFSKC